MKHYKKKQINRAPIIVIAALAVILAGAIIIVAGQGREHSAGQDAGIALQAAQQTAEQTPTPSPTAAPTPTPIPTPTPVPAPEFSLSGEINAKAAMVMRVSDGLVVYAKDEHRQVSPASTAKLLAALTVLKYAGETEEVTVGSEIELAGEGSSIAFLEEGDRVTVKMLLEGLLLPSGNDAAYSLAVHVGRKQGGQQLDASQAAEHFVQLMNAAAEEIGVLDSVFKSPDGYEADGQYTTAADMAKIGAAAASDPLLGWICAQSQVREVFLSGRDVTWHSSNLLLDSESDYYYPDASGLKTGSTSAAGKCLVSSMNRDGEEYIVVVMGCESDEYRWKDTIALMEAIG